MQRINFLFNSHQICRLANLSFNFKSFFSFEYSSSPIHYSSVTCIQGPPILSPGQCRQSKWKPFFCIAWRCNFPPGVYGTGRRDFSYMERLGPSWLGLFGWGDHTEIYFWKHSPLWFFTGIFCSRDLWYTDCNKGQWRISNLSANSLSGLLFLRKKHRKNCECCPCHFLIVNH